MKFSPPWKTRIFPVGNRRRWWGVKVVTLIVGVGRFWRSLFFLNLLPPKSRVKSPNLRSPLRMLRWEKHLPCSTERKWRPDPEEEQRAKELESHGPKKNMCAEVFEEWWGNVIPIGLMYGYCGLLWYIYSCIYHRNQVNVVNIPYMDQNGKDMFVDGTVVHFVL